MVSNMKKEKGITLIALAITIIVLLILAGISIGTLSGNKGTIKQAYEAEETVEKESIIQKIQADLLEEKTKTGKISTKEQLKKLIQEKGYAKDTPGEDSFITKEGNYEIYYNEIIGWE